MGANFREKHVRVVRNNFCASKFRGDSILHADDVIRSLWLTVSARGSSEVLTDFARQKDGPPQYRVVRKTNGRPVLKVWLSLLRLRVCFVNRCLLVS